MQGLCIAFEIGLKQGAQASRNNRYKLSTTALWALVLCFVLITIFMTFKMGMLPASYVVSLVCLLVSIHLRFIVCFFGFMFMFVDREK